MDETFEQKPDEPVENDNVEEKETPISNNELEKAEEAEFLAAMEKGFELKSASRGELLSGTITSLGKEYAMIDLGGKSEGLLSLDEIKGEDGSLPQVGEQIEAYVVSSGPDGVILSQRLAKGIRSRELLHEAAQSHIPIEGRVVGRNKGGFDVEVAGVRGFCPIGQIELRFCEDPDVHLGKKYNFRITKFDDSSRRTDLVLSRRSLLEEEAQAKAEELRSTLHEGDILPGVVRKIMDFGAFVDLGGLDGLLPVSELSHTRVDKPSDLLKEGEEIHVQVISLDNNAEKITLSLKRLEADPWDDVLLRFPEGSQTIGKVVRLQPFGAFVELISGVDGLIHISNMNTPERINHPKAILSLGDEVRVQVLNVDPEKRRIGLARLARDGEFGEIPIEGEIREGKVEKVENFGVFVILGPGRKGLIPNVEMGTSKGTDHRKDFPPGTAIKVKVIEVTDNGKRIRLSRRSALEADERAEFDKYVKEDSAESSGGFGTFADLLGSKIKK
jgi:small subunit ribosomal protein S1